MSQITLRDWFSQFFVTPTQLSDSTRKTRALIRARFNDLEAIMASAQETLDALTDSVNKGVTELKDEITRLAGLPAEEVDFTRLQSLADALASDNVPAAPPVEPPVEEPAPVEPPAEPVEP